VAFDVVHESVEELPVCIDVGEAVSVQVGAGFCGALHVKVVDGAGPVQLTGSPAKT